MISHLRLSQIQIFQDYPTSVAIYTELNREAAVELVIQMNYLLYGLSEGFSINQVGKSFATIFRLNRKIKQASGTVLWREGMADVSLSLMEIERLIQFFLAYVKYETSPVDHVDIEAVSDEDNAKNLDICIYVERNNYSNIDRIIRSLPR